MKRMPALLNRLCLSRASRLLATACFGAVLVGGLSLPAGQAQAADALVHTVGGQTFQGPLVREDELFVVLRLNGVETTFERANIRDMHVVLSEAEIMDQRWLALAPDALPAKVDLVAEAIQSGKLDWAAGRIDAMEAALTQANADDATELAACVLALKQLHQTAIDANALGEQTPPPGQVVPSSRDASGLLGEGEIVLVKLGERHLDADAQNAAVRLVIPQTVVTQLFEKHATHPVVPTDSQGKNAFRNLSPWEQLTVLESVNDPALLAKVRVIGDPSPLMGFRQSVNPRYIWVYFGRTFSGKVDGLELLMRRPNGQVQAYTNFVRLSLLEVDGLPMFDRLRPEQSLFLQWGLPREMADHPAPNVTGWKPYFKSKKDPKYELLLAWLTELNPAPDYLAHFRPEADGDAEDAAGEAPAAPATPDRAAMERAARQLQNAAGGNDAETEADTDAANQDAPAGE